MNGLAKLVLGIATVFIFDFGVFAQDAKTPDLVIAEPPTRRATRNSARLQSLKSMLTDALPKVIWNWCFILLLVSPSTTTLREESRSRVEVLLTMSML